MEILSIKERQNNDHKKYILQTIRQEENAVVLKRSYRIFTQCIKTSL
jgi:hypothetical protein